MVPAHHQPTPARNIDNDAIPFSEILLLLEELGTNAELAIETAVMELSDRQETLHSFNICHGNTYDGTKATQLEITPVYGVLQEEEVVTALVFPNVHVPQSTTCCALTPLLNTRSWSKSYPLTPPSWRGSKTGLFSNLLYQRESPLANSH